MKIESKNLVKLMLTAFVIVSLSTFSVNAQQGKNAGKGNGACNKTGYCQAQKGPMGFVDNLTDDQKAKFEVAFKNHREENQLVRLDIQEKEIELKKMEISDSQNQKAMDQKIDEIYALKATLDKNRIKFHNELAKFLTEDQMDQVRMHDMQRRHDGPKPFANKKDCPYAPVCRANK